MTVLVCQNFKRSCLLSFITTWGRKNHVYFSPTNSLLYQFIIFGVLFDTIFIWLWFRRQMQTPFIERVRCVCPRERQRYRSDHLRSFYGHRLVSGSRRRKDVREKLLTSGGKRTAARGRDFSKIESIQSSGSHFSKSNILWVPLFHYPGGRGVQGRRPQQRLALMAADTQPPPSQPTTW